MKHSQMNTVSNENEPGILDIASLNEQKEEEYSSKAEIEQKSSSAEEKKRKHTNSSFQKIKWTSKEEDLFMQGVKVT